MTKAGAAATFIKNFSWGNKDQNEVADLITNKKMSDTDAAKQWINEQSDRLAGLDAGQLGPLLEVPSPRALRTDTSLGNAHGMHQRPAVRSRRSLRVVRIGWLAADGVLAGLSSRPRAPGRRPPARPPAGRAAGSGST